MHFRKEVDLHKKTAHNTLTKEIFMIFPNFMNREELEDKTLHHY